MSQVVARWTGVEIKALREAKRLSQRDYAAELGISEVALSNLERGGDDAQLRWNTQQMFDTDLARADADVRERFVLLVQAARQSGGSGAIATGGTPADFAQSSAARTASLRATPHLGPLPFVRSEGALREIEQFISSHARLLLVTGSAGTGKTRLVGQAAEALCGPVDFQLLAASRQEHGDLASEILRYGSAPAGDDPLLTLERVVSGLTRPLVVVVDGINTPDRLDRAGRQVDAIIRQSRSDRLRFVLVVRTPPRVDLSAFPVAAATLFRAATPSGSIALSAWDPEVARAAWNDSRGESDPLFDDLPQSVQALARLPIYMQLLRSAGPIGTVGDLSAYRLVDHCVQSILRGSGRDPAQAMRLLGDIAVAQAGLMLEPKGGLTDQYADAADHPMDALPPLVEVDPDGRLAFVHDVIREYFVAARIARSAVDRGRPWTVFVLNDLAAAATTSAVARGAFEFTVLAIDAAAPAVAASVALAPTLTTSTALPAMLAVAAGGSQFATSDVLRACARRCDGADALPLARSLLRQPRLVEALGDDHLSWVLSLLRRFGSTIWAVAAEHIERCFDADMASRLLRRSDLDAPQEAIFLARHAYLFTNHDQERALLAQLVGHLDWRVRRAVADGLLAAGRASSAVPTTVDQLVADEDYKVRAGIARVVGHAEPGLLRRHLKALLTDDNWHVRTCLLDALSDRPPSPRGIRAADVLEVISADGAWSRAPEHIRKALERYLLLAGAPSPLGLTLARDRALHGLLRETRCGARVLRPADRRRLTAAAAASTNWLVQREAALHGQPLSEGGTGAPAGSEAYRRLRGGRHLQVALDLPDIELAAEVAVAAVRAGADFIEIGDPLIKAAGLGAVETIKRQVPSTTVVAEMMSSDWAATRWSPPSSEELTPCSSLDQQRSPASPPQSMPPDASVR